LRGGAADGYRHQSVTVGDVRDDNVKLVKAGAHETGKRGCTCSEINIVADDACAPRCCQELWERALPGLICSQSRDEGFPIKRRHIHGAGNERLALGQDRPIIGQIQALARGQEPDITCHPRESKRFGEIGETSDFRTAGESALYGGLQVSIALLILSPVVNVDWGDSSAHQYAAKSMEVGQLIGEGEPGREVDGLQRFQNEMRRFVEDERGLRLQRPQLTPLFRCLPSP